ncbi:mitochondrial import inner membrane translocase subunit TIM22-4 [Trifolium repens]|nr:mitochondrial import inner membrane translocase subunit TIM22-4 [Trifolium repens]
MADESEKAVSNDSLKLNSKEAEKPQIQPISLPTAEEIRGQDIWNNCAVKSVASGVMGGGLGIFMGLFLGALDNPLMQEEMSGKQQLIFQAKQMGRRSWSSCKAFAVMGFVFSAAECVVEKARAKHDIGNTFIAGCATGGTISAKGGPKAACMGCAGFAAFSVVSRPKTPQEVVKSIKESLMALDTKTVVEVKALEKALEEVEKNFVTMRTMLSGDGESEPNSDQVSQLVEEICKEDVLTLIIHKLPILGWEARKDLVHCWTILLKQKVDSNHFCVEYIEQHLELLDFLVVCYDNKEVALSSGLMLRECIKFPNLAKYILESASFVLFFKYVELPNFDVASDAFSTFKDILTKHGNVVAEFLTAHYDEFFDQYETLLTSPNYVTRRQSIKLLSDFLLESPNAQIMKRYILEVRYLKVMMTLLTDSSKNIQLSAFHIFKIFVANPNKPREVKIILGKNKEKLLELLHNLSPGKGSEDEQFEEEKEFIINEIEKITLSGSF